NCRAMATVPSVDPSSTTMHSTGAVSDADRDSRQACSVRAALNAGITTVIVGEAMGTVCEETCMFAANALYFSMLYRSTGNGARPWHATPGIRNLPLFVGWA